ncbi:hypothetical protein D3C84_572100 [compost metagenome]
MTRQAVLLEQRKPHIHRVVRLQRRIRQQGREALGHRRHAFDVSHLKGPLLGTDIARLRIRPYQIKRPGTRLVCRQRRPRFCRVFNRQPRSRTLAVEQRRGSQFGSKTIQCHSLQVIVTLDAGQQSRQGHGAIAHVPFVGNVVGNGDGLNLRMLEQFLGLPGAAVCAQLQVQLCGIKGRAEQQGSEQNERFQQIAVHVVEVPQRLAHPRWPG